MSDRGNPFLLPGARPGSLPVDPPLDSGTRRLPRSVAPATGPAFVAPESPPASPESPASPDPVAPAIPTDRGAPAPGARWRLVLPGGAEVPLDTAVLLGRDPVAPEGVRGARPIAVRDPQKTVSKTHVLLTPDPGGVRVRDLDSTNGTTLLLPGGSAPVPAGGEVLVVQAIDIELGRFMVRIEA